MSARKRKTVVSVLLIIAVILTLAPSGAPASAAVGPPSGIMRIGLYHGSTSLPAANLQNVTGFGFGYEFGYFDSERRFISIGAWTDETKITMMRDVNMYYDATDNVYRPGEGSVQIGCFHVQLSGSYYDYESARSAASTYENAYVKYRNGEFQVCVGDYTTRSDAEAASWSYNGATVTEGTRQTIAVAATGTGRVIFEFDCDGTRNLAVQPRPSDGTQPVTWFKGYRYMGAFQYLRTDGKDLTVINFINIDDYVKGILPYEMGSNWPLEALKAQALCARTYAATKLGSHASAGFDLCTEEHCQRYLGTGASNDNTNRAADETAGMYITYNGQLCETYYASSDGGATENVENVWTNARPYLRGVTDPYEADVAGQISNYFWTVTYTPSELAARLNARGHNVSTIASASITDFSGVGNAYQVLLTDTNGRQVTIKKGEQIRLTLGISSIRFAMGGAGVTVSNSFYVNGTTGIETLPRSGSLYVMGSDGVPVEVPASSMYALTGSGEAVLVGVVESSGGSADGKIDGKFTFSGTGHGHNVGMSQWGAYSMAKIHNMTAEQIVKFYYTGVEITRVVVG